MRRQVGAAVERADLGGLTPAWGEEPDPLAGRPVGEPRPSGLPAPRDQPPLPVQLFGTLEPVERLEHAEVGARDHRCRSLARGTVTYPLGIRRKELQPWPNRTRSRPRTGAARNPGGSSRPTARRSAPSPTPSTPRRSAR